MAEVIRKHLGVGGAHLDKEHLRALLVQLVDDLNSVLTLVNEIKADHNAHCADDTAHNSADTTNTVAGSAAVGTTYE